MSERPDICLSCRTVLRPGEPCVGASHLTTSLAHESGREALATTIWGPLSGRRKVNRAAAAGSVGGGSAAIDACGGCGGCDAAGVNAEAAFIILAIIVAIGAVWLLYVIVRTIARRFHKLVPNGAERGQGHYGLLSAVGVVEADAAIEAPTTHAPCAAWGVELATKRWFQLRPQLRAGATGGFRIRCDDGRIVHVPEGRVQVSMKGSSEGPGESAHGYLQALGLAGTQENGYPMLPCDVVRTRTIAAGDRVELHGPLEETPELGAEHGGGYRDAPPMRLTTRGVPRLRPLS